MELVKKEIIRFNDPLIRRYYERTCKYSLSEEHDFVA